MSQIKQVSFEGPLGTLRGLLHLPDRNQPAPAVVMLHGFTGQHIEDGRLFAQAAKCLAEAGFAVLRFDFFGSGDSDGEFDQFTILTEVADAVTALDWISAQPEIDASRIGVIGLSMGGGVTGLLCGQDSRVKAAVFWNAVSLPKITSLAAFTPEVQAATMGPLRVGKDFSAVILSADIVGSVRRYAGPGLILRGTADEVVVLEHAEALKDALGSRGTLYLIDGADHTFRRPEWQREAFEISTRWLAAQLKP
ncbi:MAG: alpha/beta fold hydrolase [Chloroflexi bacterium]|nr:alpha/beta fold hydrolase [Chloroflexota bacterium]